MSERLNADVPVTAPSLPPTGGRYVSATPVSSSKTSCTSTPTRACRACCRGMAAPLCSLTTSGMSGTSAPPPAATVARVPWRVSRVAPANIGLFPPVSLDAGQEAARLSGKCSCKCATNPTLKCRPEAVEFPGGRVPRRRKQDTVRWSPVGRGKAGSSAPAEACTRRPDFGDVADWRSHARHETVMANGCWNPSKTGTLTLCRPCPFRLCILCRALRYISPCQTFSKGAASYGADPRAFRRGCTNSLLNPGLGSREVRDGNGPQALPAPPALRTRHKTSSECP